MKTLLAILVCLTFMPLDTGAQERPLYPVVIHLSHELIDPVEKRTFTKQADVRQMILGTSATGTSETTGRAAVLMTPAADDANFLVSIEGVVRTRTVGRNRSALIYSHSHTPFRCSSEIEFNFERGFVASTPTVTCASQLVFDDFDSTRRGLIGRVVRRVAERRANQSHELARQIVERENRLRITQEFQKALDARMADANRRTGAMRAVKGLFAPTAKLKAKAVTSQDCLHVAVYDEEDFPDATQLPTDRVTKSPVEVWVHSTTFGRNGDLLVKTLEIGANLDVLTKAIPFLAAMRTSENETWSLKTSNQWIVLSMDPNAKVAAKNK